MSLPARLRTLWRNLAHRHQVDGELDAELGSYVEMLSDEKVRAGMNPVEARRAAILELGGREQVKELVRDVQGGRMLGQIGRDVTFALRTLRRNPILSAVIILTLGLAIGANTAIFSLADALLFTPLSVEHPERLQFVHHITPDGSEQDGFSIAAFEDLRASIGGSIHLAGADFTRLNVSLHGQSEPAEGMLVSG
ncbi:MAG: permease prefix domain 1-containing protein, partial [Gemmatimonadota bacterium]